MLTHVHVRQRSMSVFSSFPLASKFQEPSCLFLPRAGITGAYHHTGSILYMGAEDQTWIFILYRKQTTEPFSQPFWIIFKVGFQTLFSTIFTPWNVHLSWTSYKCSWTLEYSAAQFSKAFFHTLPHLLHFYKQLITSLILWSMKLSPRQVKKVAWNHTASASWQFSMLIR